MPVVIRPAAVNDRHEVPSRSSPNRPLRLSATAPCLWSGLYVLPHLYWALGGEVGFSALKPSATAHAQWEAINWAASVVLVLPVLIGVGLIRFRGQRVVRPVLLAATFAGASIAASHGLYGIVYRILNLVGVVDIDGEAFAMSEHPWVLWDLLVFEPWFLVEGLLFAAVGWAAATTSQARRRWTIACASGIALATVTGLLGLRVG